MGENVETDQRAVPALLRRSAESEKEARERYELEHGRPPPDDVLTVEIVRPAIPDT